MTWKLWLDDQHADPDAPARHTPAGFQAAGSTAEAVALVATLGMPAFIDFDHDLGESDDAMRFLRWLANDYPGGPIPEWGVHSANPVGRANIESFLRSWKRSLE